MTIDDAIPKATLKHLIDNWLQTIPESLSNQIDKAEYEIFVAESHSQNSPLNSWRMKEMILFIFKSLQHH
jgi:hypothetical protein